MMYLKVHKKRRWVWAGGVGGELERGRELVGE